MERKRKKSSSTTNTILHFQVVAPINKLVETVPFDMICYSLDWHPQDHISFVENVGMRALDPSSAVSILCTTYLKFFITISSWQ